MDSAKSNTGNDRPALAAKDGELFDIDVLARVSDGLPVGIFVADAQGRCIYANGAYCEIAGLTTEQALGTAWGDSVHPNDRERAESEWLDAFEHGDSFQAELRFRRRDGSVVWTRLHANAVQGRPRANPSLLIVEDITERKSAEVVLRTAEEELFAEKERAQVTLDSIGDAVLATDLAGNVTYLNREAETLTGWTREDAMGQPLAKVFRIIDGETRSRVPNPAQRAIEEDQTVGLAAGCILVRRDGSELGIEDSAAPIHNRDGSVAGAVIVFHDIAQSRAMAERMAHLARHDYLTGLANTVQLAERLDHAIGMAYRNCKQVALLFIDLDDFKGINDSCGHLVGDRLLQSIAARLSTCVRETDTVSRRGGDEFVILLAEIECQQDAAHVAEKVLSVVAQPHVIDGKAVWVSASIGISVYPDDGDNQHALMRCADVAMYQAKAGSLDGYRFSAAGQPRQAIGWRLGVGARMRRQERRAGVSVNGFHMEKSK
jgi:diguanylate cyclase (GGDEF)-like protein/PAS domain S-box-containing protein